MSLPVLIVGGTPQQRRNQVDLKPNPDLLVLETETTIGITAVRTLEKFLQRRPYARPLKTAVIDDADRLTLPAQQALLKTLEEPPAHSQIILLAESQETLIPTVVPRCLVRRLPEITPVPGRISPPTAADAVSPEAAREFITSQLRYLQYELRQHPETVNVKQIKALNLALSALKFNVNPKLTLEVLSLSY